MGKNGKTSSTNKDGNGGPDIQANNTIWRPDKAFLRVPGHYWNETRIPVSPTTGRLYIDQLKEFIQATL